MRINSLNVAGQVQYECNMLIDSHCHLNYPEFPDVQGVIARAKLAGIALMQTISTKRSDFTIVKSLAEAHPEIYCSIGIHPHDADDHEDISEDELLAEASHPRVIGIGETGLDYFYEHSPREVQKELFRRHIRVGRTLDLPVIVHSRAADDDTVAILQEAYNEAPFTFLIHCFTSSPYLAEESLKLGGYISASGIITFKKSQALRDSFAQIPLDRLLVETDSPYLAPEPYRGKSCEPAYTLETARKLAEVKSVSFETLADATTNNFFTLFTKARIPA